MHLSWVFWLKLIARLFFNYKVQKSRNHNYYFLLITDGVFATLNPRLFYFGNIFNLLLMELLIYFDPPGVLPLCEPRAQVIT